MAAAAFGVGLLVAGGGAGSERTVAARYVQAWAHGDYRAMYALLDRRSRRGISLDGFQDAYAAAAGTATLQSLRLVRVGSMAGGYVQVRCRVRTRLFGTLDEVLDVPVKSGTGGARVRWAGLLLFPGLRHGEQLSRHSTLGARGTILADDGTPLAQGPARTSPIPGVAGEIVGTLGPIPPGETAAYAAAGYPPDAQVGLDGLERIFQAQLAGRPGGTLMAGRRLLARAPVVPGRTVRTTIDPAVEQAAINALGGRYAGLTVMDPRTGALLGLAGIAFSAVQPPGSTMKIVTVTGVLAAHLASPNTQFPVQTAANIDGYSLQNASGEACGGSLLNAFAVSCNSVFAPLGARLGARRLVAVAERFGFNHPTGIAGALESTIPPAGQIGSALSVASSAIGQGRVQASTLQMADVGAAIADGGRRPLPTLVYGAPPRFLPVTSRRIARQVQQMMVAVVRYGTGTSAQISGVEVAGKTGTAELTSTANQANSAKNTDAWFVGYAPVGHPKVVACALFPAAGYGGGTAAPVVAQVIQATLRAGR